MRIVGGKFKGRKLIAPEGQDTRPTSDRARESIFNILEHQSWGRSALREGRVLDAFSGTGALGLEAYSRGAAHVTFLDKDEAAMKCLVRNAKGMGDRHTLQPLRADVSNLTVAQEPYQLIFMDAPYKSGLTDIALQNLVNKEWLNSGTICVIELSSKEKWNAPETFEEIDRRKYGAAQVVFLQKH
ncbi:16S rRNA (guanine(966)-N(2))-methyltransferase RsmD [Terasakiella sp. A23]|uniref:16S rRNA (guanine(966)-N(2))-methyltransferase RsmD n=1 Tax=Terasakiella sp. FCG-A23 TaxID=3080561 RepID=UPI002954E8DF|nr:16S rRNA (guanine(966)-N(2))-methyltransferase RsmD [Terasakiella sp. A23]MDV7338004.1 16S rRNA (guanine(966)-N(2))-methyltransferase RsmD [Terasakiella sp. A23]